MVIALDRFAGSLLSRDLEAGRWVRRYRAIVEKPPCCAQMPTVGAPKQCCMTLSSVSAQLTENGKLVRTPVKIASFLARSALDSSDPRDSAWQQREEQRFNESKLPPCALAAPFAGIPNPVPVGLRRRSVSDMHPEAKLCVTTVTLREESDTQVHCEIQPGTGMTWEEEKKKKLFHPVYSSHSFCRETTPDTCTPC